MKQITMKHIQKLYHQGKIQWTFHAAQRLQQRGILRKDVYNVLEYGKIIEQYPDSLPFPSCLISGKGLSNQPLHVVIGENGVVLVVITAYMPGLDKFENDFETRKEQ